MATVLFMPRTKKTGSRELSADSPLETLWEELSSLESPILAKQLILNRSQLEEQRLEETLLEKKALALAYCIKNAQEYLRVASPGMTITATSNYYGGLWLSAAIIIADPMTETDLLTIEGVTKFGHGLKTTPSSSVFPHNEFVAIIDRGYFRKYLRWCGLTDERISGLSWPSKKKFPESYDELEESQQCYFINLTELFSKIPELTDSFENVTGQEATNFRIHPSASRAASNDDQKTVVSIDGDYSLAHILNCNIPLEDISEYPAIEASEGTISKFAGKLPKQAWKDIYEYDREFYVSPLGNYFFISPVFGCINDPLAVHLMISYLLSILSRYRPTVWREVVEGTLDQYRILIHQYNRIFRRVIPHLVLNTITKRRNRIPIPGFW